MNKTLVALAGIAALLVIAFLGYQLLAPRVNQCEGIFQQTAPSLEANVKFLESAGGVVLASKQIQELSDRAQQVALNLKSCCVMAGAGNLDQFNQCKASAVTYDRQVAAAVETVKSVTDASAAEKADEQKKAEERLTEILQAATSASEALRQQAEEINRQSPSSSDQSSQGAATSGEASAEPGTLRLQAALTDGGEQIDACFYVYEPKEDLQGNRKRIDYSCTRNALFTLPAGDYYIYASAGDASVSTPLAVQSGQVTDRVLTLNAGYFRTTAALSAGGESLNACFYVYEAKEDLQGNHRRINYSCTDKAIFTLPAGSYLASASTGDASTSTTITIQAGQITDHAFDLQAGYLRSKAVLAEGGDPLSACFYVYDPKPDLQGNYRRINYSCADSAVFTLPAGEYLVSASVGDASTSVNLSVRQGQITDQLFTLNAGNLRAKATFSEGGQPVSACFYVYEPKEDLQGKRKRINYACTDNAIFTLPAGSYYVWAESGDLSHSEMLEIKPGELTDRMMVLSKP
ncbi:MAG: hypothetical protein R3D05_19480 [Dongiaceae bacterium]